MTSVTGAGALVAAIGRNAQERLKKELKKTVRELTERADVGDASYYETARALKSCVGGLLSGVATAPAMAPAEDTFKAAGHAAFLTACKRAFSDAPNEISK